MDGWLRRGRGQLRQAPCPSASASPGSTRWSGDHADKRSTRVAPLTVNDARLDAVFGETDLFGGTSGDSQPLPLVGLRLLVVDDTADVLESLATLLRLDGAEVTAVASGEAALAVAGNTRFDVLLSDVAMPRMDGYQLLAALRARADTATLPAVALTGYGRPADVQRALGAGFDAHVAKPIVFDHLLQTVQRLARNRITRE